MSWSVPLAVVAHRRADRRIAEFRTSAANPEHSGASHLFPVRLPWLEIRSIRNMGLRARRFNRNVRQSPHSNSAHNRSFQKIMHDKRGKNVELTLTELLSYGTVRIECTGKNNQVTAGTGYVVEFKQGEEANTCITAIITNKSVVRGAEKGKLVFTRENEDGEPDDKKQHKVSLSQFEKKWVMHPDPAVDLCALPIDALALKAQAKGIDLFFITIGMKFIPSEKQLDELDAMEQIVTAGFPDGLWDTVNNRPVLRSGVTATHPRMDYNGKQEFLIDAAAVPGTSGSPVFILDQNGYVDRDGNYYPDEDRILFLGTLTAGAHVAPEGQPQRSDMPAATSPYPSINLGRVIKSNRLLELEALF